MRFVLGRRRACMSALLMMILTCPALASTFLRVRIEVTAVAGLSVYIDKGRADGIEPGDSVRLQPVGQTAVEAVVREVSLSSSRVELNASSSVVETGVSGEVLVPRERFEAVEPDPQMPPPDESTGDENNVPVEEDKPEGAQEKEPPSHPPWEHAPVIWTEDMPLLAPVRRSKPRQNGPQAHGRVYSRAQQTFDRSSSRINNQTARFGLDMSFQNPFRRGGIIEVDTTYSLRRILRNEGNEKESVFRPNRASYNWGGMQGRATQFQVGRFLQRDFPEFGLMDGGELLRRFGSGSWLGVSAGFLPVPNDTLKTGDDLHWAVYYRLVHGQKAGMTLRTGYQKTWHKGQPDRDLIISSIQLNPNRRVFLYAAAQLDYYDANDKIKPKGLELTQLQIQANLRALSGSYLGLFVTRIRWPELLSSQFDPLTSQQILSNEVTRFGVNGTWSVARNLRLSGRFGRWTDQNATGSDGEVRVGLRDLLYPHGEVAFTVFNTLGKFNTGRGARVSATRSLGPGYCVFNYELTDSRTETLIGAPQETLTHAVRGSFDISLGRTVDLSLYGENHRDENRKSYALGAQFQRRF